MLTLLGIQALLCTCTTGCMCLVVPADLRPNAGPAQSDSERSFQVTERATHDGPKREKIMKICFQHLAFGTI
jgi:hypothetical protein